MILLPLWRNVASTPLKQKVANKDLLPSSVDGPAFPWCNQQTWRCTLQIFSPSWLCSHNLPGSSFGLFYWLLNLLLTDTPFQLFYSDSYQCTHLNDFSKHTYVYNFLCKLRVYYCWRNPETHRKCTRHTSPNYVNKTTCKEAIFFWLKRRSVTRK